MRRRDLIQLLAGAIITVPQHVAAQTTTKTFHLASLSAGSSFLTNNPNIAMLLPALAERGYKLGQNLEYTPYGADMQLDQLPQMARDIAANKIDAVVASLIGRSGSSTFRLSTSAVSVSLTGSCFSSESAPRPFHHGSRERGGTIFRAALLSDERQVQATKRTHLIHRPARDIFPP